VQYAKTCATTDLSRQPRLFSLTVIIVSWQKTFRIQPRYLLALVPIAIAILGMNRAFSPFFNATYLMAWLAFLVLFIISTVLSGLLEHRKWTGYIYLSVIACYMTCGLQWSLLMVIFGTALAVLYKRNWGAFTSLRDVAMPQLLEEYLGRIAISGTGAIVGFTLYVGLGGQFPLRQFHLDANLFPLMVASVGVFVAMFGMGILVTRLPRAEWGGFIRDNALWDFLSQFAALALATVMYGLGVEILMIIVALLCFQALRAQQADLAQAQLEKRAQEVSTLNLLGQTVSANLRLDEVLGEVHQHINQLVKPTTVFTALYDDHTQIIEYPAIMTHDSTKRWQKRKLDHGLTDWVIRNRKPLMLNMLESQHFDLMGIDLRQVDSQAFMGVPLIVANNLIGVIGVSHTSQADAFDQMDMVVLQTIASQTALAIRNASLYDRTMRLANNLAIINESFQTVTFNLDRESIMRVICEVACKITQTHQAALFLGNETIGLKFAMQVGLDNCLDESVYFDYHPDLNRQQARTIYDVFESGNDLMKEAARRCGFKSLLEIPLRSTNTVEGILVVYHADNHYYQKTEIDLLEMLANQVVSAFDNTDLLQALETYASEQAQLVHLSRVTTSNLDLERVMTDVTEMVTQITALTHVEIGIITNRMDVLHVYKLQNQATLTSYELPLQGLNEINRVMADTQATSPTVVIANDEKTSPLLRQWMLENNNDFLALMPMMVNKQVFGVLFLGYNDLNQLNDSVRRLIELAIHQISAQVHNARVHTITEESLTQQLEQLSLIEDIAQKISQSLDLEVIIENVLDAALRATQADYAELALDKGDGEWQTITQVREANTAQKSLRWDGYLNDTSQVGLPDGMMIEQLKPDDTPRLVPQVDTSSLSVPLLLGEKTIGWLRVRSSIADYFTTEHANFLRSLAGHAAISIDNAQLLEERQYQVNTLTALRTLTLEAIGISEEDNDVVHAILKTALTLLSATEVALFGYDTRTDEIVPMVAMRQLNNTVALVDSAITSQPSYVAARHHRVEIHHRGVEAEYDSQGNLIYPTVVAIPIERHQQVREILVLGYAKKHTVQQRDLTTMELLALQVASLLENNALNQAIQNNNDRIRTILDSTRDGVILLDTLGRIQEVNLTTHHLLQFDLKAKIGEPLLRVLQQHLLSDEKPLIDGISHVLQENTIEPLDVSFERQEETVSFQLLALPVRDNEGLITGRLLSLRDITADKQVAATRESLQRMVLHDLRSPMGAIITGLSFMQMLLDDFEAQKTRDIRRTLDASLESATSLLRLMDTLRDLPRMKDMAVEAQPIYMHILAQKAYDSLQALFGDAHIHYEAHIDPTQIVQVDIDLIRRVLINLLHNALKFTPSHGTISITSRLYPMDMRYLQVLVCDTGPGIPPDMREKIFEEFQQIEATLPKRGGRGTGLGLTLCKLAVEAHGGKIWVESEGLLSGACFAFTLPLDEVNSP
jgi:two-component system, NtrC family, sensor histidine kinase KinB